MSKLGVLLCVLSLAFFGVCSQADLKMLTSSAEFNQTIQDAQVPVVVQFSAYWCGPCQRLKETLTRIAPDYTDDKVLLCYVDAYVNSDLKVYLDGGYPTVRSFSKGKMQEPMFVGNKSESFVRNFIDTVVALAEVAEEEQGPVGQFKLATQENPAGTGAAQVVEYVGVKAYGKATLKLVPVISHFGSDNKPHSVVLKEIFKKLAPSYDDSKVSFAYIDVAKPENKGLKSYLMGINPTVRVFQNGELKKPFFVVSKNLPDDFTEEKATKEVKAFIDNVIKTHPPVKKPAPKPVAKKFALASQEEEEAGNTLIELKTMEEFNQAISDNSVPAMVQFSAHWCNPCQKLKARLVRIAPSYSTEKIRLYYVDAYVLSDLKKYLQGGYPTCRAFENGQTTKHVMVGDNSDAEVRRFLDGIVKDESFSPLE